MTDRCLSCFNDNGHQSWCPNNEKPLPDFDGPGYIREYDLERLTTQKDKIFEVMKGGTWRTLGNISHLTGAPEASASAMLRAFRATKHGGHTVNRRRRGDPTQGWHEYQLIVKPVQLVLL